MKADYLLRKASFVLMTDLDGSYRMRIAKGLNMDKEYLFILLQRMEGFGLLKRAKKGRICLIYLTEKGKELQLRLRKIYTSMVGE